MKNKKSITLAVLPLVLFAAAVACLVSINQKGFSGSRVKNPDAYLLDIEKMNGTDQHALELCEGDVLQIRFETEKDSMYMEIQMVLGPSL